MQKTLYQLAVEQMKTEEIDHWQSDLYLKKNAISMELVKEIPFVKEFKDNIDGKSWYEIPFKYDPFWIKPD